MSKDTTNCPFCTRIGLSLLPLRLAYVAQTPSRIPSSLTGQSRFPAVSVRDGGYVLRLISTGFVYVYEERAGGIWRCYGATPTGHMREMTLDAAPTEVPAFQCGRAGHTDVASLINISNAKQAGTVWIGYSRVWLTKQARRLLKADESLRRLMMVRLDATSVVQGGSVPADTGKRVGSGAEIASVAGEFAETDVAFAQTDQLYAKNTTTPAVARVGQAQALVDRMSANSPGNAIVLALPDPVGIVQDINHWRNIKAGELAQYQGSAEKLRHRIVGDLILGIQKAMQVEQGEEWVKRYAPKVDMLAIERDKRQHLEKVKEYESKILKASHDWCAWVAGAAWKNVWKLYDGMDAVDGRHCGAVMESDFSECVFGSGATPQEQLWWKEWLTAEPDSEYNALWLALAAGDKDVVVYLKGDAAKPLDVGNKGVDIVKNSMEAREQFLEWHNARKAKGLLRPAQEASGLLANNAAAQLQLLANTSPQQALVAGHNLRMVITTRMEIVATPRGYTVTLQQFVMQLHETAWGPPKTQLSKTVVEARGLKIQQSVEGAFLGSRFSSTRVVVMDVWLPEPAVKLGTSVLSSKAFPTAPVDLPHPRPPLNAWQGMGKYIKTLSKKSLVGLGAALQISNLCLTLLQLDRTLSGDTLDRDDKLTETLYGVLSGSLGVLALAAEVSASAVSKRVALKPVATTAARVVLTRAAYLALGGGVLGVASSTVDGIQAWGKGRSLRAEGDRDAASSSFRAAGASFVAGFAGAAIATIGAGAALSAVGASGVVATSVIAAGGLLAVVPVFGWLIILVGAIVAGLYLGYRSATEEDTPLERWLSRCYWRNEETYSKTTRKKYETFDEEMAEFQQAMYGLSVTLNWNDRIGKDEVEVLVVAPGYGKSSELAFMLELTAKGRRPNLVVLRRTSAFSEDVDLRIQPPVQHFLSSLPPGQKSRSMSDLLEVTESLSFRESGGAGVLAGRIRVSEDYFSGAKLKVEYWPDAIQNPELRMTPVPGGRNFVVEVD